MESLISCEDSHVQTRTPRHSLPSAGIRVPNYFKQVHSLWGKDREGAGAGKGLRQVKGHNSCDQGGKARLSLRAACEDRGSHGRDINPAPTPPRCGAVSATPFQTYIAPELLRRWSPWWSLRVASKRVRVSNELPAKCLCLPCPGLCKPKTSPITI